MPDRKPPPTLDRREHPYVFSASQIETADLCMRKWAFEKIDRLEREETASTILGTEVHGHLEEYLEKGIEINTKVRSGKIAMSGLPHLPAPMAPGMDIEKWFVRKTGVATYWGLKDVQFIQGAYGLRYPLVYDHKTCKSFAWAKNEDDLRTTVQSGMYGWDVMEEASKDIAQLRWTYMRTQGSPLAMPVVTNISRMEAEDVMAKVDKTAERLILIKKNYKLGEAIEVTPNFLACEAFGGCPRKSLCKPSAAAALSAMLEQKTMEETLLEDLKNRKKKKSGTPSPEKEEAKAAAKEEDKKNDTKDAVNPPDRSQEPPPPPAAKQAGGKWFQAVWSEDNWAWEYPPAYQEALDAEEAAKKAAEKAANSVRTKKSTKTDEATSVEAPGEGDLLDALLNRLADLIVAKMKG